MGARLWLLVEGTSYDATIFDTDDLATIRGASWSLLELPDLLPLALSHAAGGSITVRPVFTGASQGLYELTIQGPLPGGLGTTDLITRLFSYPAGFRPSIEAALAASGQAGTLPGLAEALVHMRFAFGLCEAADHPDPTAATLALLRRRLATNQYGSLDVDLPQPMAMDERFDVLVASAMSDRRFKEGAALAKELKGGFVPLDWPCTIDKSRPRADFAWRSRPGGAPTRDVPVSASVAGRRNFGRAGRRRIFYRRHAGVDVGEGFSFADSFEEIAVDGKKPAGVPDTSFRKMAVLAMDGNAFTEIRRAYLAACATEASGLGGGHGEALASFSKLLIEKRKVLLGGLLDLFLREERLRLAKPSRRKTDHETDRQNVLRLETLLWGADEAALVFPAWAIQDVLGCFEVLLQSDAGRLELPGGEVLPLSYSIGIVLCNFKTPIRLARKLAEELSQSAKAQAKLRAGQTTAGKPLLDRLESMVDIAVLGGIDAPARSLGAERKALFNTDPEKQGRVFPFPLAGATRMLDAFVALKGEPGQRGIGVPRAKLAAILDKAVRGRELGLHRSEAIGELHGLLGSPRYRSGTDHVPIGSDLLDRLIESCDADVDAGTGRVPLSPLLLLLELWNFIGFDHMPVGQSEKVA